MFEDAAVQRVVAVVDALHPKHASTAMGADQRAAESGGMIGVGAGWRMWRLRAYDHCDEASRIPLSDGASLLPSSVQPHYAGHLAAVEAMRTDTEAEAGAVFVGAVFVVSQEAFELWTVAQQSQADAMT